MLIKKLAKAIQSWLLVLAIVVSFITSGRTAWAQIPPGPPPPAEKPPTPSANMGFLDFDKIISPNPIVVGQGMTYTFRVKTQGPLDAHDAEIELRLVGNQKVTGFDPGSTGWSLVIPLSTITNTVRIKIGILPKDGEGKVRLFTLPPTNLGQPVIRQALYLKWSDTNGYYDREHALSGSLANPPGSSSPIEPPPPTSGKPASNLPTTGPFAPKVAPAEGNHQGEIWYFPVAEHYVSYGFLAYWRENEGVLNLGWPISEEFEEAGQTVQYFERGVLEFHPENTDPYRILLRALGREAGQSQPPADPQNSPDEGAVYYSETGHWLSGRFAKTWEQRGGLKAFGYPIAEMKAEGQKLVQWFERARFEIDLSLSSTSSVTLTLLGREAAVQKGYLPAAINYKEA